MNKIITSVLAVSALGLGGCMGHEVDGGTDDATPAIGAAEPSSPYVVTALLGEMDLPEPPVTTSSQIVVEPQFDFPSARAVPLAFDVEEVGEATTNLSVCLDWEMDDGSYDVDYASCVLRTRIVGGRYEGEITLANQYDAVLGVFWFDDPSATPVYRELRLADL